jgi:hypothetical protein
MARNRQTIGPCPRCGQGTLSCSYNLFAKESLTIHSWEHRCADCGHRETQAFRSDQTAEDQTAGNTSSDPTICPFCGRPAVA